MATTTPNYGWTVPTSTDLVKDGATAIETLGDAIDASMNTALGTKKAGMVLLNTTSFSGVATQSFNNVFTSAYENYRIIYKGATAASVTDLNFRLRASGTDNSSAAYEASGVQGVNTGATLSAMNQATATSVKLCFQDNVYPTYTHFALDLITPQLAQITTGSWQSNSVFTGNIYSRTGALTHGSTTQFDGFSLLFGGNSGGKISIYGYNF